MDLDSKCTMHASHYKSIFCELTFHDEGEVSLGDHTTLQIKVIGTVPNQGRNLISESALGELGCQIYTSNGVREVSRENYVLMRVINQGGLYYVQMVDEVNVMDDSDVFLKSSFRWHSRLDNVGNKGLY